MNSKQLLDLPIEIIETVLSYCSYDEISMTRMVSKVFNETCQRLLNHGFSRVDKYHAHIQRSIKNKLPRRESERRNHPLAKHVNALSAIETRLSLLNMTYMKYVDMQLCSFIPGKVLDEMLNVLRALADVKTPPRTHELLQELRDISSMAMEHFDDKIVPNLRSKISVTDSCSSISLPAMTSPLTPCISPLNDISQHVVRWSSPTHQLNLRPPGFREEMSTLQATVQMTTNSVSGVKRQLATLRSADNDHVKKQIEVERKLKDQARLINEQNQKQLDQERRLRQLDQSHTQCQQQLTQLYREVATLRTEVSLKPSDNITGVLTSGAQMALQPPIQHLQNTWNVMNDETVEGETNVSNEGTASHVNCEGIDARVCGARDQFAGTIHMYPHDNKANTKHELATSRQCAQFVHTATTQKFSRFNAVSPHTLNMENSSLSSKRKLEASAEQVSKRRITRAAKNRKF